MFPRIQTGNAILFDAADKRVVDSKVYALIYGTDNYGRIKRLYRTRDGLRIVSVSLDKERFPDEIVEAHKMEHVYIVRRVIDKSGSGGL